MAWGRRHFEARQRPEAPQCWLHLNPAVWPEVCGVCTKACKQTLGGNNSRTKPDNLVKMTPRMTQTTSVWARRTISRWRWFLSSKKARKEPESLTGIYLNSVYAWPRWWRQNTCFLLPVFESGIRCSRNLNYFPISMMPGIFSDYNCWIFG